MARDGSQREGILKYLKVHGSITPLDALREFGCMRLASRISELRCMGYDITSEMEITKNTAGQAVHYARYRLEESR